MSGSLLRRGAQRIANLPRYGREAGPEVRAYHGSPYAFDRFDSSRIGTGEGAQVYGHGLYFAGNEDVARFYRDALSPRPPISETALFDGRTLAELFPDARPTVRSLIGGGIAQHNGDVDAAIRAWRGRESPISSEAARLAELLRGTRVEIPPPPGHMYEVRLRVPEGGLLDWDQPLNMRQPDAALDVLLPLERQMGPQGASRMTAGDVIQSAGNLEGTSTALRDAGLGGLRYFDAGSRTAGQGTRNYVMFDDNLIDIARRYAVPMMLTTGGIAASARGLPRQDEEPLL